MQSFTSESSVPVDMDYTLERLKLLDTGDRILLGLYYYEKLSQEEISMVLKISTEAVEKALESAFAKLVTESLPQEKQSVPENEVYH